MTKQRPRGKGPVALGLTGSIAMGKTTAAQFLRRLGVRVFDADAVARELTGPGGSALPAVAARFPGVVSPAGLDRKKMSAIAFSDRTALRDLEGIIHPLVHIARERFLRAAALRRARVVAFDVPLLFEGKSRPIYDFVAVVTAPAFLQEQRALRREGMSVEKLKGVRARQMSDHLKRRLADAVIPSGLGKRETLRRLRQVLKVATKPREH